MKCPIDGETLNVAERSGVEIDYCPKCRGVWLDRGELDKIIDRTALEMTPPSSGHHYDHHDDHYDDDEDFRDRREDRRPKRRESFLGDLFDFF